MRMSDEEKKQRRRQYSAAYYKRKKKEKGLEEKKVRAYRRNIKLEKPSYIKVKEFTCNNVLVEATTRRFKSLVYKRHVDYTDDASNYHRKKKLEKMLNSINTEERIVVLDDYSVQVYLKTKNNLQEIVTAIAEFVENNLEKVEP